MSADDRIVEMLERESVRRVISGYCIRLDEGDMEGVAECFDATATADYGPGRGGLIMGAPGIVARIALGQSGFRRTHHQLGQVDVTFDGAEAHALSYVTAWHERFTGEQEIACLRYVDVLRHTNSAWLIVSRRVDAAFVDGFPGTDWNWVRRPRNPG